MLKYGGDGEANLEDGPVKKRKNHAVCLISIGNRLKNANHVNLERLLGSSVVKDVIMNCIDLIVLNLKGLFGVMTKYPPSERRSVT